MQPTARSASPPPQVSISLPSQMQAKTLLATVVKGGSPVARLASSTAFPRNTQESTGEAAAQPSQEAHVQYPASGQSGVAWEAGRPAAEDGVRMKSVSSETGTSQEVGIAHQAGDAGRHRTLPGSPQILRSPPMPGRIKTDAIRAFSPEGRPGCHTPGPMVGQRPVIGLHPQACPPLQTALPVFGQGPSLVSDSTQAHTPREPQSPSSALIENIRRSWLSDSTRAHTPLEPRSPNSALVSTRAHTPHEPRSQSSAVVAASAEKRGYAPATVGVSAEKRAYTPTMIPALRASNTPSNLPYHTFRAPAVQEPRSPSSPSLAVSIGRRACTPTMASAIQESQRQCSTPMAASPGHRARTPPFAAGVQPKQEKPTGYSMTAAVGTPGYPGLQLKQEKPTGYSMTAAVGTPGYPGLQPKQEKPTGYSMTAAVGTDKRAHTPTFTPGSRLPRQSASCTVPMGSCMRSAVSRSVQLKNPSRSPSDSQYEVPAWASRTASSTISSVRLGSNALAKHMSVQKPIQGWKWPGQAGDAEGASPPDAQDAGKIITNPSVHQTYQGLSADKKESTADGKSLRWALPLADDDREGFVDGTPCHRASGAVLIDRLSQSLVDDEDDSSSGQDSDLGLPPSKSPGFYTSSARLSTNISSASTAEDESDIESASPLAQSGPCTTRGVSFDLADSPCSAVTTMTTGTAIFEAAMSATVTAEEARHPQRAGVGRLLLEHSKPALIPRGLAKDSDAEVVKRLFFDSMPESIVTIDSIEQLISPKLLRRFLRTVAKERGAVEATFHGTKPELAKKIVLEGLSTGICQTGAYGFGAYVGTHAGVAHQYADPDKYERRYMCLVLVVAGKEVVRGQQGEQPRATALDKLSNPTQYCFVDEERLLVSHLITYRAKGSARKRIGGGYQDLYQIELGAAVKRAAHRLRKHGFR